MNPGLLLAVLISLALSGFGGYRFGVNHERGAAALRENETAVATAIAARESAEVESARALSDAQAAAKRRASARDRQHRLEMEIARDETARHCRVSDDTIRLLNDAIASANGAPPEAGHRNGALPAAAAADRPDSGRPGPLGNGYLGAIRRLPSQSPTVAGLD